jgi:hypothetical protein
MKEDSVLNPVDRISEVLFGLIMVLTFTGAISVATDGHQQVRELLWAALGCNVAWGFVDAIMYIMNVMMERGHGVKVISGLMATDDSESSRKIIRSEIPPMISSLMTDAEIDHLQTKVKKLPSTEGVVLLTFRDIVAASQIFMLVFFCTLPVALPFAFVEDVGMALRTSNGVAVVMLFIGGFKLARYAGFRPGLTALTYTVIGVVLVSVTMALGG